jgi:hypothetical protein
VSELFALHHDEVMLVGGYFLHVAPCCAAEGISSALQKVSLVCIAFSSLCKKIYDFYINSFQVLRKYFNFLQFVNEVYKIYFFKYF